MPSDQNPSPETKPKLLVLELWGLGDLVIATPFLRAALDHFDIMLLAKPFALDLKPRLWPAISVVPFTAPWTAFKNKYHLWRWPLREMLRLRRNLVREHFEFGLSGRWDPRDHLLLKFFGAQQRLGFPRMGSRYFLTRPLTPPEPEAHRYEHWRIAAESFGIALPSRKQWAPPPLHVGRATVLVHSGARLPARVWPLAHWRSLTERLRTNSFKVQVASDVDQFDWWRQSGETSAVCPRTVTELLSLIDQAGVFIGNCSGPGHLAAISGVPTFTVYGPSLPDWFAPLHPSATGIEGKACPYKPCSDYCRYPVPYCLWNVGEEEVWARVKKFVSAHVPLAIC